MSFSLGHWDSDGNELCPPLVSRLLSLLSRNMIESGLGRFVRSFNLCNRYIDGLIVFNNKMFGDYVKEIYPSQIIIEKANRSDDLANYLDLIFINENNNRLYTNFMTNVMISISTLSVFYSFRAIFHLALPKVFIIGS